MKKDQLKLSGKKVSNENLPKDVEKIDLKKKF